MAAPLHRRLRAAREYAGLSRLAVARAIKVSEETIARYERGDTAPTGTAALLVIAELTGVPDSFILEGLPEREALDPATRFEDAAGEVHQRRRAKPPTHGSTNDDRDAGGEAS